MCCFIVKQRNWVGSRPIVLAAGDLVLSLGHLSDRRNADSSFRDSPHHCSTLVVASTFGYFSLPHAELGAMLDSYCTSHLARDK